MGIGSVIGAPFTVASTATRHMLDANVTFGSSSDRYNARDKYRRTYSDQQRLGAGVGTALGVALPVAAGVAWMQRGLKVPGISNQAAAVSGGLEQAAVRGMSPVVMQNIGRVAGVAALGVATAVGVKKTIEITKDDGNLGAVGTAAGVVGGAIGGAAIGKRFGGKIAAVSGGLGALAGGIAGHYGGKAIKIGESQIGKEHVQAAQVDTNAGDRVGSFARGAFNHFNEVGPATQGISFGYQWGMRDTVQKKYSNSERAGAMHGDLLAAGILGGGALAVATGLMGQSAHAAQGVSNLRAGADIAGGVLSRGAITSQIQRMGNGGAIGMGAAAAAIAGVTGWKAFQSDKETFGGGAAAAIGVGTLAATAGTAALISRSGAMSTMAPGAKAASSALVAAALIGVLSSARLPLQQFMNDAKDAHAANQDIDPIVKFGATGVGAAAGGFGAFKGLSKMVPDSGLQLGRFHIPKGVVVAAGTALGGAAVGGIGLGLSATMPDAKTVGLSVAGGAVAGAGLGFAARGLGVVPGIIGGAAIGLTASSLLKQDAPASPAETTPQDAAGSIGG
ncbi:MAG: hypothetical protein JWL76_2057 [Thermoleophilia bacterium]|nr:hypothetical protein [Thermoleophilia bacterium]